MQLPQLMPFQEQPFNGDKFIEASFLKLKKLFSIDTIVETGTCLGSSAIWFANNFETLVTIEANKQFLDIAIQRVKENCSNPNILFGFGKSEDYLRQIISARLDKRIMFFLDAHWGASCPLREELQAIADLKIKPVIAIHDFVVPGSNLGYDEYNGQKFTFEWLEDLFDAIYGKDGYWKHYNSDEESAGAKRGIIYVYPKEGMIVNKDEELTTDIQSIDEVDSEPVLNNEDVFNYNPAAVTLYINHYKDKNDVRQKELDEVLMSNINEPLIDRVVLVTADKNLVPEYAKKEKVIVIVEPERTTYKRFFEIINRFVTQDSQISIIANSDIIITPTCATYIKACMKTELCFALSCWDKLADGSYRQGKINAGTTHVVPKNDSQDCWVFKGKVKHVPHCDFTLGRPACDNVIADSLTKAGYIVLNPSNDIRPVHLHLSGVRNYNTTEVGKGENPDRVEGDRKILNPISMKDIPATADATTLTPAYTEPVKADTPVPEWIKEIDAIVKAGKSKETNSQFEEDEIISHVFKNIGILKNFFVDLGAGAYDNNIMSNSQKLVNEGWEGIAVDAKDQPQDFIVKHFIKPDNIVEFLKKHNVPKEFDFLNLDIDSCDYWVLENILKEGYRPGLICTEYNGTLDPSIAVALRYEDGYTWDGTNKYGYSFAAGEKLLSRFGYSIIYNLHDTNIFAIPTYYLNGGKVEIPVKKNMYHPVNPNAKWDFV